MTTSYHNARERARRIVILVILIVLGAGPSERILECKVLACEDDYYDWYVFESGDVQNPGFYRVASPQRRTALRPGRKARSLIVIAVVAVIAV